MNDACTLIMFLVDFAVHSSDSKLKRDMLSVLVGQLIDKIDLVKGWDDAASAAHGGMKTALLAAHAMFDGQSWRDLLLARHIDEHWGDTYKTLEELYKACYAIPHAIYRRDSPALRGVRWPAMRVARASDASLFSASSSGSGGGSGGGDASGDAFDA